jgi:hypothetical protein
MTSVCVVDVGSPVQDNLWWAIVSSDDSQAPVIGNDLVEGVGRIAGRLIDEPVALGFEAPMYVPIREKTMELLKARKGEGARPWSAGAGAQTLTMGIPIATYMLQKLREKAPGARAFLNWKSFRLESNNLLLFEAFVSGKSKGKDHTDDANLAASKMLEYLLSNQYENAIQPDDNITNLLGMALLKAGWSTDIKLLDEPCLVVSP